jgi:hypothetical protein
MTWHVQYRLDGAECVVRRSTPEEAIEAACMLIDKGHDVFGIGTGDLSDSIEGDEITRIYAMWARARASFGRKHAPAVHREQDARRVNQPKRGQVDRGS